LKGRWWSPLRRERVLVKSVKSRRLDHATI
jgi:hypothetical protein